MPSTTRAYAKVSGRIQRHRPHPDAFRKYLLEQLRPLMDDFTVQVQVGRANRTSPIPTWSSRAMSWPAPG